MRIRPKLLVAVLLVTGSVAHADFLGSLKDTFGGSSAASNSGSSIASGLGLAMPAMGASTMGNAAGVLQYCIKNNYLSGAGVESVKEKLLGTITGKKEQESGYASGASGLLKGTNGSSLNLVSLKSNLTEKACDYVLNNAKSLI